MIEKVFNSLERVAMLLTREAANASHHPQDLWPSPDDPVCTEKGLSQLLRKQEKSSVCHKKQHAPTVTV